MLLPSIRLSNSLGGKTAASPFPGAPLPQPSWSTTPSVAPLSLRPVVPFGRAGAEFIHDFRCPICRRTLSLIYRSLPDNPRTPDADIWQHRALFDTGLHLSSENSDATGVHISEPKLSIPGAALRSPTSAALRAAYCISPDTSCHLRRSHIPEATAAPAALPLDNWFPGNVFIFDSLNNQVSRTLPPRWWNTEPWLFLTHSQSPSTSCPLSTCATTQATGTLHVEVVLHYAVDKRTRQQSNHDHDHPPLNEPGIVPQPSGFAPRRHGYAHVCDMP